MSYVPNNLYGSLNIYGNTTALNTSGGFTVITTGWSAGNSVLTTLNATNGTITINATCEVAINFTGALGPYTDGNGFYYMGIYINGSRYTQGYIGHASYTNWAGGLDEYIIDCIYSATYGDIIEVQMQPVQNSDPGNRPVVYLANLSVVGIK